MLSWCICLESRHRLAKQQQQQQHRRRRRHHQLSAAGDFALFCALHSCTHQVLVRNRPHTNEAAAWRGSSRVCSTPDTALLPPEAAAVDVWPERGGPHQGGEKTWRRRWQRRRRRRNPRTGGTASIINSSLDDAGGPGPQRCCLSFFSRRRVFQNEDEKSRVRGGKLTTRGLVLCRLLSCRVCAADCYSLCESHLKQSPSQRCVR